MVDPVAPKPGATIVQRIAAPAPAAPVAAPQGAVRDVAARADPSTLKALAGPLTAAAPVDTDRVAKIRKAIADGNFPLIPSTVADRLIALRLEWNPRGGGDEPA